MGNRFIWRIGLGCAIITLLAGASSVEAQDKRDNLGGLFRFPEIQSDEAVRSIDGKGVALPSTAMHGEYRTVRKNVELRVPYTMLDSMPLDSIRKVTAAYSREQFKTHSNEAGFPPRFSGSELAFYGDQDSVAIGRIKAWLDTRGLVATDQAAAYLFQIEAATDPDSPERITGAEVALQKLATLGAVYTADVVGAHSNLIKLYYQLGNREKIITHTDAILDIALKQTGRYMVRVAMLDTIPITQVAQAYAGGPNGAERVRDLLARYRSGFVATEADRAAMSPDEIKWYVPMRENAADRRVAAMRAIGTKAPDILAHAWINVLDTARRASPLSRSLADGKVRVVEFGSQFCGPCKEGLAHLERMIRRFNRDSVEFLYVTSTTGSWFDSIMKPEDEVQKCRDLYLTRMNITLPIAIWAGDRNVDGEEGAKLPEGSPNLTAYHVGQTPVFVMVDGAGRIRYRRSGYNGSFEEEIRRALKLLMASPI